MITQKQTFTDMRVVVDGETFKGCTFNRCLLVFAGGALPYFSECAFNDHRWHFEGPAQAALEMLAALYQGGDTQTVEAAFNFVRGVQPVTGTVGPGEVRH